MSAPPPRVDGPRLPAGDAVFRTAGVMDGRAFAYERPFHVGPPAELVPGPFGPPLIVDGGSPGPRGRADGPDRPPVWPFVVAALLLCAEWAWRRRIGLR